MIFTLGRWRIECDPDATAILSGSLLPGGDCDCRDCRNFLATIETAVPPSLATALASLGVDIRKPSELCHSGRDESGRHLTGGLFHFVGEILSGADAWTSRGENCRVAAFETIAGGVEIGFTKRLALVPKCFEGREVVQVEFLIRLPWVMGEPESP